MLVYQHAHGAAIGAPEPLQVDRLGLSQARKDETPDGANGQGFKVQTQVTDPNCTVPNAVEQLDKELATLRAQLALSSWTMHIVDDGRGGCAYWVSRWGQTRTLGDRDQLRQFVRQIGAAK